MSDIFSIACPFLFALLCIVSVGMFGVGFLGICGIMWVYVWVLLYCFYQLHRHGTLLNLHTLTSQTKSSSNMSTDMSYGYDHDESESTHKRLRMDPFIGYSSSTTASSSSSSTTIVPHSTTNSSSSATFGGFFGTNMGSVNLPSSTVHRTSATVNRTSATVPTAMSPSSSSSYSSNTHNKRSREEIEAIAKSLGAKGG